MKWQDSLGEVTRIPKFSTGNALRFKRSQSSVCSTSDVPVSKARVKAAVIF